MTLTRLRAQLRGDSSEDGVAMLMSLALIAILTTLMLAMLAIVVNQVRPTAQARKDVGSVNAASSGLQAGLTQIRNAVVDGVGNKSVLPCPPGSTTTTFQTGSTVVHTAGALLSGTASSTLPGSFAYQVSIAYYASDPTDKAPSWLQSNALACPLPSIPLYVYLQSYGTGANIAGAGGSSGNRGNRSQTGVYRVGVLAGGVSGGRLRIWQANPLLCIDAGAAPGAGSLLYYQPCLDKGTARQSWQYRPDLSLFYGGNPGLNLCIQASAVQQPQLQRCVGTGDGATWPYSPAGQQMQEWAYNDSGHFAVATSSGDAASGPGNCLMPPNPSQGGLVAAGTQVVLDNCEIYHQEDLPDNEVGVGKAGGNTTGAPGSPTNQFVNFQDYGHCLDVTNADSSVGYLISYSCKQAPNSTKLLWNQVWTFTGGSGVGQMRTTTPAGQPRTPAGTYCLTAPASGAFPSISTCDSTRAEQGWQAPGPAPGSPSTAYHLVSTFRTGQCLAVGPDKDVYNYTKIALAPCADNDAQRWNAPPPVPPTGLSAIAEGSTPR